MRRFTNSLQHVGTKGYRDVIILLCILSALLRGNQNGRYL
jgi:hypothetical protein